jgi:hypothetical protein
MSEFPVTVAVRTADGSVEQIRVGTAIRTAEGFSLRLGELTIGSTPVERAPAPMASERAPARAPAGAAQGNFPNYGRSKGGPIAGATLQDLEYYANGCRRTLADPAKARWHDKERELLASIEGEIARQGRGGSGGSEPPNGGSRWNAPAEIEPPPHGDDDIPF